MTFPANTGVVLKINAFALKRLIDRNDNSLGEAMVADLEAQKGLTLSEGERRALIAAFEAGYAAALTNVARILE